MWEEIESLITQYEQKDRELIHQAFLLAEKAHAGQFRASGEPYIIHPVAAAKTIIGMHLDATTIAATLLHDVLEDTDLTKDEIKRELGDRVLFLIESLTKLDKVRYRGHERQVDAIRRMFLALAEDIRVVIIKLAERLHNVQTLSALRPDKQVRIARETLEIYAPLAYRLGMGSLKGELEDICFPIVYPEEAGWTEKEAKTVLSKRKKYLEKISRTLSDELYSAHIEEFSINFRTKHSHSLWKKLLKNDLDISRITDLVALRIIVEDTEQCYRILGIIHTLWKPVPGKIRDYISLPKPNGYQSLHTTVYGPENIPVEFQVRTKKMHQEAEYGVAAHWAYTEQGKPLTGGKVEEIKKMSLIEKLRTWQEQFASGDNDEFVEALKIDLFHDRIFVFTPRGEVIDLPEGSTPIDFAYHIHSEIGDKMTGVKVNGKMVAFSHTLLSGDSVEIIISKNAAPSADWLPVVRTSLARSHIRSNLRKRGIGIKVDSHQEKRREKDISLLLTCDNRVGVLKNVTTVFTKDKINITKVDVDSENIDKPHLLIKCVVPIKYPLETLMTKLHKVRGVLSVEMQK